MTRVGGREARIGPIFGVVVVDAFSIDGNSLPISMPAEVPFLLESVVGVIGLEGK